MQIDHSRGGRLVPETLLYGLYVLTGLKQMGGIRVTQGVSGKRRVQPSLYKTFLQAGTDEVRCDGSILTELLEDEILARIVLAVNLENYESPGLMGTMRSLPPLPFLTCTCWRSKLMSFHLRLHASKARRPQS